MKSSGNKIVSIFSAIVLGLMLIVPVLPASFLHSKTDLCDEAIEESHMEITNLKDSNQVFVGFSIGREISLGI